MQGKKSLRQAASHLISSLEDFNLVQWALSLVQTGNIERAWNRLVAIRGIGGKIASFYLRDIVDAFEIDEDEVGNKVYLQPIDIWTRRGAKTLAKFIPMTPKSDWECAQVLVEVSERASVRSTFTNTGLWVLGAQLVRDEARYQNLLLSIDDLRQFLSDQMSRHSEQMLWHQERAKVLENVLKE